MGVSFTWEKIGPVEEHSFASGSSLNSALENLYGYMPVELGDSELNTLRGLAAVFPDVQELMTAIAEHGRVRVKSHW